MLERAREFLSTPSARRATVVEAANAAHIAISIHALREEGDRHGTRRARHRWHFYPRPPRGGRPPRGRGPAARRNFYPRPPRGGRLPSSAASSSAMNFYPRPPRGGRPRLYPKGHPSSRFLSTPSARRATSVSVQRCRRSLYFYPRPPRGGRLSQWAAWKDTVLFLSTPSARRATSEPW